MTRDPSLHITKSRLEKILKEIVNPHDNGIDHKGLAKEIMKRATAHSIHTRSITVTTERIEKKGGKLLSSSRLDAALFAQKVYHIRKGKFKHRGITPIKPGSRDWEVLKEVTGQALEFKEEFHLTREKGFHVYIEVGISKMQKFMINKFLGMHEGICERYQAIVEIEQDDDSIMTKSMYKHYNDFIVSNTGIYTDLTEIPERYIFFVRARKIAEELNLNPNIYIDAQFDGLDFTKKVPHPSQLVGIKAKERVMRYCFNQGIKVKK